MTEETSGAQASSQTSSSSPAGDSIIAAAKEMQSASQASSLSAGQSSQSPSVPSEPSVVADILQRLALVEGRTEGIINHLQSELSPRLIALEEGLESLAKRAESMLPDAIVNELSELKQVVASLGGGITGATGHDAAKFFHAWWDKITGKGAPAPAPATQTAAGASVTNSGPLAAGGAPIPLQPSTK